LQFCQAISQLQGSNSISCFQPSKRNSASATKRSRCLQDRIVAKEARLKLLWNSRLGHQMEILPQFDMAYRAVRRRLRQVQLP
jgi:hypothetical protein